MSTKSSIFVADLAMTAYATVTSLLIDISVAWDLASNV